MTYVYEVGKEFLLRNGFTAIVIDNDFGGQQCSNRSIL